MSYFNNQPHSPWRRLVLIPLWSIQIPFLSLNIIYLALLIGITKSSPSSVVDSRGNLYTVLPGVQPYAYPQLHHTHWIKTNLSQMEHHQSCYCVPVSTPELHRSCSVYPQGPPFRFLPRNSHFQDYCLVGSVCSWCVHKWRQMEAG
jgi:hypothetical protein